jgi:WD40 repeat protein
MAKIPFGSGESVRGLNFARGGRSLAIASSRGRARLMDLAPDPPRIEDFPDPNEQVRAVAFSGDGSTLASVSDGTSITVWDVRGHRRLFVVPDAAPHRTAPHR